MKHWGANKTAVESTMHGRRNEDKTEYKGTLMSRQWETPGERHDDPGECGQGLSRDRWEKQD